jgi:hypothetical protein
MTLDPTVSVVVAMVLSFLLGWSLRSLYGVWTGQEKERRRS